jgi:hypothetical protein
VAVSKLSLASVRNGFAKSNTFWDQTTFAPVFDSIQTIVVGSGGAASVTFSGIPQSYQNLQIRYMVRDTATYQYDFLNLRLNNDSGSNYRVHQLQGNGSSAASVDLGTSSNCYGIGLCIGDSGYTPINSSAFAVGIIDILEYKSTNKNCTIRSFNGFENNDSTILYRNITLASGLWTPTPLQAVNTITLIPNSGTFKLYSHFALYGIKGA